MARTAAKPKPVTSANGGPAPSETAPPAQPKTARECACGCGETVARTFKQGHDQRLISLLASDIVYHDVWSGRCLGILKGDRVKWDIQDKINEVSSYVSAKLSAGLAAKFEAAASRAWEQEKVKSNREAAKARRAEEKAAKPKRVRKAGAEPVATSSEEAEVAKPTLKVVKPTATNDDVDAAEAASSPTSKLGQPIKVRVGQGKRVRTATVTGMNQAGKVTAVTVTTAGKDSVKTEGQFTIVS